MRRVIGAIVAVLLMGGTLIGVSTVSASAASANAPLTIGLIIDVTGAGSSGTNAQYGAQARIDAVNADGGVDGHKLQLVVKDDQNTPAGNLTAAQDLVQTNHAFAIMDIGSYAFAATQYLNQAKEPVVGAEIDGPEWGQQPNSNMFSVIGTALTPYNGKLYTYTDEAVALKQLGVTKLAQLVYNIPSAISAASEAFAEAKPYGISNCLDSLIPENDVNFTTFALQMKTGGCNGLVVLGLLQSCIAVQTSIKQADLKVADICDLGYDEDVLDQPAALAAMQGTYTGVGINVLGKNLSAPTKLFLSRLKKYTSWPGGIPADDVEWGYESADLIVQGLGLAGVNATRQAFISDLHKVSDYTAGGLIAAPGENFTHFGTLAALPKTQCEEYYEVLGHTYVPAFHGKPACGKLIAVPASG